MVSINTHKILMEELFESNRLNYLYVIKKHNTYILSLINNSFEERDFFRNKLFDLNFPYINLEFMPDEIKESDFISDEIVKLELLYENP